MQRRTLLAGLLAATAFRPAWGATAAWQIDTAQSTVAFIYRLQGVPLAGRMPVAASLLDVDLADIAGSRIEVTLDARRVSGGFLPATRALRSDRMFATATYPTVRFVSTRIVPEEQGARVTGDLTIRDITRPVDLQAHFDNPAPDVPGPVGALTLSLDGRIDRALFGLTAYRALVDTMVELQVQARLVPMG